MRPGAGIVVVRDLNGEHEVLCLICQDGTLDLTKGVTDGGESSFEAAKREAKEEAGIDQLSFQWGSDPYVSDNILTMYVAKTEQEPIILKNPHTGTMEHRGIKWLTFDECLNSNMKEFLKPSIEWAQDKVNN